MSIQTAFKKIIIDFIPHTWQRYETVGDYFIDVEGNLRIKVSELGDWRMELLVAIHELWEYALITNNGVKVEDIDKFDMEFERLRPANGTEEPGDDPDAPYVREHCSATGAERMLAAELNVCWKNYEERCNALFKKEE